MKMNTYQQVTSEITNLFSLYRDKITPRVPDGYFSVLQTNFNGFTRGIDHSQHLFPFDGNDEQYEQFVSDLRNQRHISIIAYLHSFGIEIHSPVIPNLIHQDGGSIILCIPHEVQLDDIITMKRFITSAFSH